MKQGEKMSLDENEHEEKEKYLSFEVDKNDYALPIKYVDDIIGFQEITEIPDVAVYIKGIIIFLKKMILKIYSKRQIPIMNVK